MYVFNKYFHYLKAGRLNYKEHLLKHILKLLVTKALSKFWPILNVLTNLGWYLSVVKLQGIDSQHILLLPAT